MKNFLSKIGTFAKIFIGCAIATLFGSLLFCFDALNFLSPFAITFEVMAAAGTLISGFLAVGEFCDWDM